MTNNSYIGIGGVIALLIPLWWHEEVVGRVGRVAFHATFSCLTRIGMGACQKLWFVGLHQENQIAGLIFWAGVALAVSGLWRKYSQPDRPRKDT